MYQRIVVKLGTSVLTGGTPHLDRAHLVELVRQCAQLRRAGSEVVVCTSGAIAAGRERLGFPDLEPTITTKQMLAAVGQSRLMRLWEQLFDLYGLHVGQVLLTRADVQDRARYLNAADTLRALLAHGIVPIINENDAVATAEIKVGDNDNLSALAALLAQADALFLLTDQPGLFTADPRTNPEAALISEVSDIDAGLRAQAGGSVSGLGTGGMATKLEAADLARRAGIDVVIAAGHAPDVLTRLAAREAVGTRFPALGTPLAHRKRWIAAGARPAGTLTLDAGALAAVCGQGRSLLPSGLAALTGSFDRGDTVSLCDAVGTERARGLVRYAAADLARIKGCQSSEIEERLGYAYGPVIVHRNDLVVL